MNWQGWQLLILIAFFFLCLVWIVIPTNGGFFVVFMLGGLVAFLVIERMRK